MKRIIVVTLILLLITTFALGQTGPVPFEVEMLKNPNAGRKDTREVNAVLVFEKDGIRIQSRRSKEIFKEFRYADIRSAEHTFRRRSPYRMSRGDGDRFECVEWDADLFAGGEGEGEALSNSRDG